MRVKFLRFAFLASVSLMSIFITNRFLQAESIRSFTDCDCAYTVNLAPADAAGCDPLVTGTAIVGTDSGSVGILLGPTGYPVTIYFNPSVPCGNGKIIVVSWRWTAPDGTKMVSTWSGKIDANCQFCVDSVSEVPLCGP